MLLQDRNHQRPHVASILAWSRRGSVAGVLDIDSGPRPGPPTACSICTGLRRRTARDGAGVAARVRTGLPHQPTSVRGPHPACPTSRASPCSSPAWSTCSGRRWALPRSSCWSMPAAGSRCRAGRPAAASPRSTPATAPPPRRLARGLIATFAGYDYVVAPSGSCAGMLRAHLPELFDDEPGHEGAGGRAGRALPRAGELSGRRQGRRARSRPQFAGTATYHDSCSGLRELQIKRAAARPAGRRRRARRWSEMERERGLLRLRRHVLRQVSGDLDPDGLEQGRAASRPPAPICCWRAISAA